MLLGMVKTNTYFAAASWYDDDDSEVCHSNYHEPMTARRIPCRMNLWSDYGVSGRGTRNSYLITDEEKIKEIKDHNSKILGGI